MKRLSASTVGSMRRSPPLWLLTSSAAGILKSGYLYHPGRRQRGIALREHGSCRLLQSPQLWSWGPQLLVDEKRFFYQRSPGYGPLGMIASATFCQASESSCSSESGLRPDPLARTSPRSSRPRYQHPAAARGDQASQWPRRGVRKVTAFGHRARTHACELIPAPSGACLW